MLRVLISPTSYAIHNFQKGQNPYITGAVTIDKRVALSEHAALADALENSVTYNVRDRGEAVPDIVFAANGGLSLPGLPERVMILPTMKYPQRKAELPYLRTIAEDLGIKTILFPHDAVFEGQAEAKWFHGGKLLICGYGYRATPRSFVILQTLLDNIYTYYNRTPPKVITVRIADPKFFHLDAAMLDYDDTKCIVHRRAFSSHSLAILRRALGKENVHVLDTDDDFCLNAIVDNDHVIAHTIKDHVVKNTIESLTGRKIISVNTSVFELAGGSARCMVLDIHPQTK